MKMSYPHLFSDMYAAHLATTQYVQTGAQNLYLLGLRYGGKVKGGIVRGGKVKVKPSNGQGPTKERQA